MMKRLAIVLALTLPLGGCLTFDSSGVSVFKGGNSITAPIANPATPVNIFQVKSVYASALELAGAYRDYCYPTNPFKSYKALMDDPVQGTVCKTRRSIVAKLDVADDQASDAIAKADAFIKANPTLSAASVIRDAYTAVTNFQGAINTTAASVAPVQQ
jgi:hypothetical protein